MMDDRRLRVLVVDDHDVVHWGFRLMLSQQPWVERCLSAQSSAAVSSSTWPVGSSAMISRGAQASAIAIITRWRMPPEYWCG